MGREVRKVPENWNHPKDEKGSFVPLYSGAGVAFAKAESDWNEGYAMWQKGLCESYRDDDKWEPIEEKYKNMRFTEYHGGRPSPDDYMPDWPDEVATHFMMYEDTSEGTPISPAFATPEELAKWLTETGASAFGDMTGTYEGWLRTARGGYSPSMIMYSSGIHSGIDFFAQENEKPQSVS